jgi:putative peptidoglycan lipid II flippase
LVREPLTAVILQRQAFSQQDTVAVATTLTYYLPGMPAAAIDQILLFACYARGRTLAPNLVQAGAIAAYVVGVRMCMPWLGESAETLAMANTIQWIAHMVLMVVVCQRLFDLRGLGIVTTLVRCVMAAAVTWCLIQAVLVLTPALSAPLQLVVVAPFTFGVYVACAWLLGITPVLYAVKLLWHRVQRVLGRGAALPG